MSLLRVHQGSGYGRKGLGPFAESGYGGAMLRMDATQERSAQFVSFGELGAGSRPFGRYRLLRDDKGDAASRD